MLNITENRVRVNVIENVVHLSVEKTVVKALSIGNVVLFKDGSGSKFNAENADTRKFIKGEVISINNQNKAILASANSDNYGLGLAVSGAEIGFSETIQTGSSFELDDWTDITGTQYLDPRQDYFLSETPGKLTETAPATAGTNVQKIGSALTQTKFEINIGYSIKL